ncbi:MAG: N-acetylmuramoyl-L-alanine amidase [Actinomycetota bacterium]|nr:N-acetylmuramoyl-L-alanine amidase [Actinomycetota bacterium]
MTVRPIGGAAVAAALAVLAATLGPGQVAPTSATPPAVTAAAASASRPLAGKVITIDPGHNGRNWAHPEIINRIVYAGNGVHKACNTTGTSTRRGLQESAHNLWVARKLRRILERRGARVVFTRTTNRGVGPCITRRAKIGNRAKSDAVLSIHADGNDAPTARGFHIIRSTGMVGGDRVERASKRLARTVRNAFRARTGMPYSTYVGGRNAMMPRRDIGGMNLSKRPAVMVETGNMRHATDAALLSSRSFRLREARALARGLQRFLTR